VTDRDIGVYQMYESERFPVGAIAESAGVTRRQVTRIVAKVRNFIARGGCIEDKAPASSVARGGYDLALGDDCSADPSVSDEVGA